MRLENGYTMSLGPAWGEGGEVRPLIAEAWPPLRGAMESPPRWTRLSLHPIRVGLTILADSMLAVALCFILGAIALARLPLRWTYGHDA